MKILSLRHWWNHRHERKEHWEKIASIWMSKKKINFFQTRAAKKSSSNKKNKVEKKKKRAEILTFFLRFQVEAHWSRWRKTLNDKWECWRVMADRPQLTDVFSLFSLHPTRHITSQRTQHNEKNWNRINFPKRLIIWNCVFRPPREEWKFELSWWLVEPEKKSLSIDF